VLLAITEGLATRWPALLLAALPFLLTAGVSTLFSFAHMLLVGRNPQELPLTTGEWVEETLRHQGLTQVTVGPTDPLLSGMEGYIPHAGYLALQPTTYRRRDPAHWAMGAHELGHALHLQSPLWRALFLGGRAVSQGAGRLVSAGLVAAFLLGGPLPMQLTLGFLLVALLADVLVAMDEAWASATALRLLRQDERLRGGQIVRALASAAAALSAHLSGAFARLVLLAAFFPLAEVLATPLLPDLAPLPWPTLLFLGGVSLILAKRAVRVGIRALLPRPDERLSDLNTRVIKERAGDLGGGIGALVLIAVALTLPASPWRDVAVLLALVPGLVPISEVLQGFVLLPLRILRDEVHRLGDQEALLQAGVTPEDRAEAGADTRLPGGLGAKVAILDMNNRPSIHVRALELLRVLYLPLLVVYWVQAIALLIR